MDLVISNVVVGMVLFMLGCWYTRYQKDKIIQSWIDAKLEVSRNHRIAKNKITGLIAVIDKIHDKERDDLQLLKRLSHEIERLERVATEIKEDHSSWKVTTTPEEFKAYNPSQDAEKQMSGESYDQFGEV